MAPQTNERNILITWMQVDLFSSCHCPEQASFFRCCAIPHELRIADERNEQ